MMRKNIIRICTVALLIAFAMSAAACSNANIYDKLKADGYDVKVIFEAEGAVVNETQNVRIVEVEGYDLCACCAPHVAYTGEIGLVKILDFEKHRGGTRISIAAGYRALRDYRVKYVNILKTSALFSEPQATVSAAAEAFLTSYEELKARLKQTRLALARLEAERIPETTDSYVGYYPDFNPDELREVVNSAKSKVGGILIALSGADGDLKLVMSSAKVELSPISKKILSDLGGRGGGRDNMIQGSVSATFEDVRAYFLTNKF